MQKIKSIGEISIHPDSPLGITLGIAYITALITLTIFVSTGLSSQISKKEKVDSQMIQLASENKPEAMLWAVTKHEVSAEKSDEILKDLAGMGNARGMFLYGLTLERAGDSKSAYALYKKSANEGYEPAVRFIFLNPETSK